MKEQSNNVDPLNESADSVSNIIGSNNALSHPPPSDSISTTNSRHTYPADCYSLIATHGPLDKSGFFYVGLIVWLFQICFLALLVMSVVHPNEDTDNPDKSLLSTFIPSNVDKLTRWTQFMAMFSYCIFADESLKDIVTAVELWPQFSKVKTGDKVGLIMLSSILRFIQGMLGTSVALLLVINTADIIEIVLNFTAVNFVSGFDQNAFEWARWGKYGPRLEAEAKRIEELPVPDCIHRKNQYARYRFTVIPVGLVLITILIMVSYRQNSIDIWLTQRLRMQFKDGSDMEPYSGCYDLDRILMLDDSNRANYESFNATPSRARFGYCEAKWRWYLHNSNSTNACNVSQEHQLAISTMTYTYDISSSFGSSWQSRSGAPLDFFFFEDKDLLSDENCGSFLGDGICNDIFNSQEHNFDRGDCCAATCNGPNCGIVATQRVFDTDAMNVIGYPHCKDPSMKPVTILLNDIYPKEHSINKNTLNERFMSKSNREPYPPVMILDCDGYNVLKTDISSSMINKTQTVKVTDGALCTVIVKNMSNTGTDGIYVNYSVFHGDEDSIWSDPIIIVKGDSFVNKISFFHRIENCFFERLHGRIDKSTIYTGKDSSNKAVSWLMEDSSGFTNCEDDNFIERYALAAINFAAPIYSESFINNKTGAIVEDKGLWITTENHCIWEMVGCVDGSVRNLNFGDRKFVGTIATEIALLQDLHVLGMGHQFLYGSIPSEIGQLDKLEFIEFGGNSLTGTIPTEIGKLVKLRYLSLYMNSITGTIPNEINKLSNLTMLSLSSNYLTGTIPTVLGEIHDWTYLGMSNNSITGTIPSDLGKIATGSRLDFSLNNLTGSVPSELFNIYGSLRIYGNELSDLIPITGSVICSEEREEISPSGHGRGGDHYCNCESDCIIYPFERNVCTCEEAQDCCKPFLSQYSECIFCEFGPANPSFYVNEYKMTCMQAITKFQLQMYFDDVRTGCNEMEALIASGCICKSEAATNSTGGNLVTSKNYSLSWGFGM